MYVLYYFLKRLLSETKGEQSATTVVKLTHHKSFKNLINMTRYSFYVTTLTAQYCTLYKMRKQCWYNYCVYNWLAAPGTHDCFLLDFCIHVLPAINWLRFNYMYYNNPHEHTVAHLIMWLCQTDNKFQEFQQKFTNPAGKTISTSTVTVTYTNIAKYTDVVLKIVNLDSLLQWWMCTCI